MTCPVQAIIARCRREGIELRADGDRLCFRPVEAVDAELHAQLLAYKGELLSVLAFEPDWCEVPTGSDTHDDAQIIYLPIDDLDRRVLDCIDRGETIPLTSADFRPGGALCSDQYPAVYNNT